VTVADHGRQPGDASANLSADRRLGMAVVVALLVALPEPVRQCPYRRDLKGDGREIV
jgi:hypothetical protein